uniref:Uncharacterized protein n=1 Tax=Plectus sambesii TaxID=2011161 RepID=A0A914X8F4_9BILA
MSAYRQMSSSSDSSATSKTPQGPSAAGVRDRTARRRTTRVALAGRQRERLVWEEGKRRRRRRRRPLGNSAAGRGYLSTDRENRRESGCTYPPRTASSSAPIYGSTACTQRRHAPRGARKDTAAIIRPTSRHGLKRTSPAVPSDSRGAAARWSERQTRRRPYQLSYQLSYHRAYQLCKSRTNTNDSTPWRLFYSFLRSYFAPIPFPPPFFSAEDKPLDARLCLDCASTVETSAKEMLGDLTIRTLPLRAPFTHHSTLPTNPSNGVVLGWALFTEQVLRPAGRGYKRVVRRPTPSTPSARRNPLTDKRILDFFYSCALFSLAGLSGDASASRVTKGPQILSLLYFSSAGATTPPNRLTAKGRFKFPVVRVIGLCEFVPFPRSTHEHTINANTLITLKSIVIAFIAPAHDDRENNKFTLRFNKTA